MKNYTIKERIILNTDEFTNLSFYHNEYCYFNNLKIGLFWKDVFELAIIELISENFLIELESVFVKTRMFVKNTSNYKDIIIKEYGYKKLKKRMIKHD